MFGLSLWWSTAAWAAPTDNQLPDLPAVVDRWDATRAWGSSLLVTTVVDAAQRLAWDRPDLPALVAGDLSVRGGGPMFGHSTHDKGIDADLGLFRADGRPTRGFTDLRPEQLDPAATWELIRALRDTGNIQFILLDQGHIDVLRDWLSRERGWAPSELAEVFLPPHTRLGADRRGVVRHAPNHRSHLHIRVAPPPVAPKTH